MHRIIKFYQKAWLSTYINTDLRKKAKITLFVTTEKRRNYLISEPNYHTTNFLFLEPISNRNEKDTDTYE